MAPCARADLQKTLGVIPFRVMLWADALQTCSDFASDAFAVVTYVTLGHYSFAGIACTIFLRSGWQQWKEGGFIRLMQAARESERLGVKTDTYLAIVENERTVEAPLSLFLTYYAYVFTTSSLKALLIFPISMALSLKGVVTAVYERTHLNC